MARLELHRTRVVAVLWKHAVRRFHSDSLEVLFLDALMNNDFPDLGMVSPLGWRVVRYIRLAAQEASALMIVCCAHEHRAEST